MKTKRILSVILCLFFIFGTGITNVFADVTPETAEVYVVAQAEGGFLTSPGYVTVSADSAENYGFTDSVEGVSVLDVLVQTHLQVFGDDFTSETASVYLSLNSGYINTVFGIKTSAFGFLLNGGTPNDGTESLYGGYNGTTVSSQIVQSGDKLDFFVYADQSYYSDEYTWIDGKLSAAPGGKLTISVSGSMAMMGYLYQTPDDFKASAEALEGVSLAWIDSDGALTEIENISTDDKGYAIIEIPSDMEKGAYYITATGTDDSDSPVIMNPAQVLITDKITTFVSISDAGDYVTAKGGKIFNRIPVTLSDKPEYTIDDVLKAAHEKYSDDEHGYSSASGAYGLSITKLWGNESGAFGYFQNDNSAWSLSDKVSDGDFIYAYIYKDTTAWSDIYTKFESNEVSTSTGIETTVTLQKFSWTDYSYIPCEGVTLTIAELPEINGTTDENGRATFTFSSEGTYTVLAKDENMPIVPASMVITVADLVPVEGISVPETLTITEKERFKIHTEISPKNATDKTLSWESSNDEIVSVSDGVITGVKPGTADITVTTNDGGFKGVCTVTVRETPAAVQVMHNIAASLSESGVASDVNAPWFAADLSSYRSVYPNTENYLSKDQIQEYLDILIPAADAATSPGELAKYIIALRALGYDPENIITSDFRVINIADKLKTLIEENNPAVTNIYTLPYVIIAVAQDENYIDKKAFNSLINSAIEQKEAWLDNTWGIDAAAAMLLALAPYYDTNADVKSAADDAVEVITNAQSESGIIGNASSTGLAIAALSALNIDGAELKKENASLIDGLMTQAADTLDAFLPTSNSFSTEQGFRGLVAWQCLANDTKKSIYDFSENPKETASASWGEYCPVTFNVVPEGALVTIEGETPVSDNKYDLSEGEYYYSVSKDGYISSEGSFTVNSGDVDSHTAKTINISLSGKPSSGSDKITVNIKILTHNANECNGEYTYKNNSSAYKTLTGGTVSLSSGQTVFDALHDFLKEKKIDYVEKSYGYISSIDGIEEFNHGPNSGWIFMVDGKPAQKSCRDYVLRKKASVTWFYTDDYTNELGSEPWTSSSGGSSAGYTVKFQTGDGGSIASVSTQNGKITKLPEPASREGYVFDGWYLDSQYKEKFDTSSKITKNITLYAKWTPVESKEKEFFKDVSDNAWYYEAIKYVSQHGLMIGTGDLFEPDKPMTRGMFVTVLFRIENTENEFSNCIFDDVDPEAWYYDAVVWASENNLIKGTSETTFSPDINITREQAAVILFKYAQIKGYLSESSSSLDSFDDADLINDWAVEGMSWANGAGIINGTGDNLISPKSNTTRAQMSALIMRLYNTFSN